MTQAFLIVVRVLLAALVAYWTYKLWIGARGTATRCFSLFLSAVLLWQIIGGPSEWLY